MHFDPSKTHFDVLGNNQVSHSFIQPHHINTRHFVNVLLSSNTTLHFFFFNMDTSDIKDLDPATEVRK
jgi:hypothetical protein